MIKFILATLVVAALGTIETADIDCVAASHDGRTIRYVSGGKTYQTVKGINGETTTDLGSGDCVQLQGYAARNNMKYTKY